MTTIFERIDEHIEFHESIDSHKSDVIFLKKVKIYIEAHQERIKYLEEAIRKFRNTKTTGDMFKMFDLVKDEGFEGF